MSVVVFVAFVGDVSFQRGNVRKTLCDKLSTAFVAIVAADVVVAVAASVEVAAVVVEVEVVENVAVGGTEQTSDEVLTLYVFVLQRH